MKHLTIIPIKEIWQMPVKEYMNQQAQKVSGPSVGKTKKMAKTYHAIQVRQAVKAGQPVPPEVLEDYPELAKPMKHLSKKSSFMSIVEGFSGDLEHQGIYGKKNKQRALDMALNEILEGYRDLEEAKESVKTLQKTEEVFYTARGLEVNADALEEAIRIKEGTHPRDIKFTRMGDAVGREYHETIYAIDPKINEVMGYVKHSYLEGESSVQMIEVKPEYRRKGIGLALLNELQSQSEKPITFMGDIATKEGQALWKRFKKQVSFKHLD